MDPVVEPKPVPTRSESRAAAAKLAEAGRVAAMEAAKAMQDTASLAATGVQKSVDNGARDARNLMETSMEQASKAAQSMMKAAEDAAEFGRGNVEAMGKATQIYIAGMQDLGRQTFAMVQGMTQQVIDGAKALSAVKSLHEAAQLQSNLARVALEKSVAESVRLGESVLKLSEQASAPLTARMTLAAEKFTRPSLAA